MKRVFTLLFTLTIIAAPIFAQDMVLAENVISDESVVEADRHEIDHSQLPSSVVRALDEGTYEGVTIAEVFVLRGRALRHATAQRTDLVPRLLYELQLWNGEELSTVYFTEQGEVYEADRSV